MGDVGAELGKIPFDSILGAPIDAVIKAQEALAFETIKFIKANAFVGGKGIAMLQALEGDLGEDLGSDMMSKMQSGGGQVQMVTFEMLRNMPDGTQRPAEVAVPFILFLPIPTLQIQEVTVTFDVTIEQQETESYSDMISSKSGFAFGTMSFKRETKEGSSLKKMYNLDITMSFTHDPQLPQGLEKLIDMMTNSIAEQAGLDKQ
mmetsp:Transcript_39766/g.100223  ORF Transcript_39766/g.100223 Transcript_39766/m.100223 type:complete len:204 (+) Transcript_39766:40-651(+)|eukprot:CAMPEP_0177658526 /NCGR_PEP_ID=MMETSP0447-20121125/16859_1 /TAXON_ID=0 /ORGANISM="Stygamoeba regulata, Strain BSH-02190019" /LENGTH=203 /DNA_ID=CAMNT_0019163141 /DNA_START=21 /DNA_END=632 /DNA_ORIENTATION=+